MACQFLQELAGHDHALDLVGALGMVTANPPSPY
jgi:hypothetical protein